MRYAQTDSFPQNPAGPSPPGARPHAGTSSHGSGQRPIRCPLHTTAASPCLALPCLASPGPAAPRHASPRSVWMLPHPSRQRHALAVGYENCCLEFCCGLVSEPMLPPSRLSAPLLGPPSPRGLSSHHQSHGPLSSFPGGLLLRPPYRYGLHAAQTGFLRPGPVATFRLVCRACSPSPFVVKTVWTSVHVFVKINVDKCIY